MKAVSIMWSEGVDPKEAEIAITMIYQLLQIIHQNTRKLGFALPPTALRPFGTWVIPTLPEGSPYSSTGWYLDSSYRSELNQIDAPAFLELVRNEPWQRKTPHYDIALIDTDLTDTIERTTGEGYSRYSLSSILPGVASVISVKRLHEIADEEQRLLALRRLVVHTFGHLMEVPQHNRTSDVCFEYGELHCTNRCVMRHAATVSEIITLAEEEVESNTLFCSSCHKGLLATAVRSLFSLS